MVKKVIDKSVFDDIMKSRETEEEEINARYLRRIQSEDNPSTRIPPERSPGAGIAIREREQAEGVPSDVEGRGPRGISRLEGEGLPEIGRESHQERDVGERGLEHGYPGEDTGERERLSTSNPKDIVLRSGSDIGSDMGAASRFDTNLLAIKTLKDIEDEGRQATPAEQSILAKYSGFGDGAFNAAFERYHGQESESWRRRGEELKAITTEDEYKAIKGSRLNAFYTTPEVIKAMWAGLERMGIDNLKAPHVLEPSAGSGRFLGFQPTELTARSHRTAVELDSLTGQMLKHLYPDSETYVTGFESAPLPKESYDIAISNVPFGKYPVFDPTFKKQRAKLKTQIHNYFFAKTLERLRPGGVLSFITTHGTLDAPTSKPQRELLAEEADFLGAIRLPRRAFPDTDVVTDIIYMRKRAPGDPPTDKSWVDTEEIELQGEYQKNKYQVNKYFLQHPEMVMGTHSGKGSMRYGDEYTVEPLDGSLAEHLNNVTTRLPSNIIKDMPPLPKRSIYLDSAINVRENSYVVDKDGTVRVKRFGSLEKADLSTAEAERVVGMLKVRDAARKVLDLQLKDATTPEIANAQVILNSAYSDFASSHGALRNKDNKDLMKGDSDGPFMLALEKGEPRKKEQVNDWRTIVKSKTLSPEEQSQIKMPLFNQRTVKGLGFQEVKDETDAMMVALNETGRLDFDRMAQLLGKTPDDVIKTLSNRGEVFRNPVGDWEIASSYLSGEVRDKLRNAEMAAEANVRYKPNVAALKEVQPTDLKASEISVSMGAPWIPANDVNRFINDITNAYSYRGGQDYFIYSPQSGQWSAVDKIDANESMLKAQWGTNRMPANRIIDNILNGKLTEVFDKTENVEGKEVRVRNGPETIAAQEKARAIEKRFKEWVWEDEDRTDRLLKFYNETYNSRKARHYNGQHQIFPGMSEDWARKIHSHQKDAIWRVVQDRTALLAHEVGFGKTAVMVGAGMELRRLGLSRKNLYVVPKSTHGQFQGQFAEIYPYANYLAPTDDDFSPGNRAEFISRVATGDWDAVILTNDQFLRIPLRPETEARFLEGEIASFTAALEESKEAAESESSYGYGRRRSKDKAREKTQKEIEKAIKTMYVKLQDLQAKAHEIGDKTIYFEDLGIDQMFLDEADNFKNLSFATQMGRIKGLSNTKSDRAWNMYGKTRYLQEKGTGAGVVFATGTPVANTIAEMYTMMRYLQEPTLEAKGLQHFDAWAKTFGETTESLEQTPTGQYKMTQRFAKFQNAPELSQLWQDVADIRVADENPAIAKIRPRIIDDNGKERRTVVAVAPDEHLKAYMALLVERADNLKNVDPHDDNMLKLANDARKAGLDVRMVNPSAPGNPEGKIAVAANNVGRIYQETNADNGIQLVFLDLGTPKTKEKIDNGKELREEDIEIDDEETAEEKALLKNVYASLKDALISEGVPANKIAFIHDAKSAKARERIQDHLNAGDIRVIIGSTAKLGVGVNVQERAAALHHLDCPWRPRDIEQREGRIIRQGNKVYGPKFDTEGNIVEPGKGVRIYTYVTQESFDGYMWQAVEAKSKAIKSIMRRENPPRAIEDCDSFTMSASEAKAVASGNPDVMKQVSLKNSVTRLQMLQSSYLDSQIRAREQLRKIPEAIKSMEARSKTLERDAAIIQPDDKFSITVKGQMITERPEGNEAFLSAVIATPVSGQAETIAKFKGFDVVVTNSGAAVGYQLAIHSPATNTDYPILGSIPYNELGTGTLTKVENTVKRIGTDLAAVNAELVRQMNSLKGYEKQASEKFEYETQLDGMDKELDRITRKLQGEDVLDTPSDIYIPEEELPTVTPVYRFTPRGEPELEQQLNPEMEIALVRAEIEPYTTPKEVYEPTKAELAETAEAIENIAVPAHVIKERKALRKEPIERELGERLPKKEKKIIVSKPEVITETIPINPTDIKVGDKIQSMDYGLITVEKVYPFNPESPKSQQVDTDRGRRDIGGRDVIHVTREVTPTELALPEEVTLPAKPKKERKPRKPKIVQPTKFRAKHSVSELRGIHASRSARSIASDERQTHNLTLDSQDPRVNRWISDQGMADISGIDTPSITERGIRLPTGRKVRISQRRPRLPK